MTKLYKRLKVISPVNGVLEEVNEELEINPNLTNADPFGEGWIYKIKPDEKDSLAELHHGVDDLQAWMAEEIKKYEAKM